MRRGGHAAAAEYVGPQRPRGAMAVMATMLVVAACLPSVAHADPAATTHPIAGSSGGAGITVLLRDAGFACTAASGYNGTEGQAAGLGWASWQYWAHGSPPGAAQRHNCTTYVAFRLKGNGYGYPGWTDDATGWEAEAWNANPRVNVDQTAVVGAIAQWNVSSGHVAYVEAVTDTFIEVTSDNFGGGTNRLRIARSSPSWPDNFIHFADRPSDPPQPPPAKAHNLLLNAGFESGFAGWGVLPGGPAPSRTGRPTPRPSGGRTAVRGTRQRTPASPPARSTRTLR